MKIVKLKGGLGNQMFQYVFAKILEQISGEEIKLDYSAYGDKNDIVRVPRIARFKISLNQATDQNIKQVCLFEHKGKTLTFKYRLGIMAEHLFNRKYFLEPNREFIQPETIANYLYYDGYWQSWRYTDLAKEIIHNEFVPRENLSELSMITFKEMQQENSVFLGVRKGDYSKELSHYGIYGQEYYRKCMQYIAAHVKCPVFYVFSNDITWCKENIDFSGYDVRFREPELQTDDFEELILMSACKHGIMLNSTYHWWGAYLIKNPQKIICHPLKWFADEKPIDIYPKEWVAIE